MSTIEFVESYFDAWNHHDPVGVAKHIASDGIYMDVPENRRRTHDELITSLHEFFSEFPLHYELIGDVLTNGDTIAYQYRMTRLGAENEGASPIYRGAEFVTLRDDAALLVRDYYDVLEPPHNSVAATHSDATGGHSQKYAKSGLGKEQLSAYKEKLDRLMQSEQLFLYPELTLPKLADAVGCSVNHLSQVINSGFGVSFFDYVNRYRIEQARRLLVKLDDQSNAILNIAFTVGFNSNSAFYSAFKKFVGQTPAQYRRRANGTSH